MHPSLEYCEIDIVIPVGQRVEVMSQITHLADATEQSITEQGLPVTWSANHTVWHLLYLSMPR